MGTIFTVKVVDRNGGAEPPAALSELVETELEAVNRAMSTYLPDSELENFNRHGLGPFAASAFSRERSLRFGLAALIGLCACRRFASMSRSLS